MASKDTQKGTAAGGKDVTGLTLPTHDEDHAGKGLWDGGSDEGDDDAEQEPPSRVESGGALGGLTKAFKDLGTKLRGKSHRFSDLLHLHKEVLHDLSNSQVYPELEKDAELRRNNDLSPEETAFLAKRRHFMAESGALKQFLGLPEDEVVHPDDVPIIAFGGSGGGYRACLGFLSALEETQQPSANGPGSLFDLLTYVAGVSGSCWTLGALYSFASLHTSWLLDHFTQSSDKHPLSMAAINAVARSAMGVYFQLGPILQKLKVGHLHPGPLDLYGTLVTSHIFHSPLSPPKGVRIPGEESEEVSHDDTAQPKLHREWFQFSRCFERTGVAEGKAPLPILTAIRHERPWKDWKSPTEAFGGTSDHLDAMHNDPHAWWQWFEFSPIEFGSDELEGWIPTWSFGRQFSGGKSTQRLPERSLSLILSIATSAPAGPLAAWLGTLYRNLPTGHFGDFVRRKADEWVEKNPRQAERLQSHHPIHAQNEANPFYQAERKEGRGNGFENSPRIHLVDSGMSNNLPLYTFFRPHRDVDVVLLGDYSSDVQSGAALHRIGEFGRDKGLEITVRQPLPDLPPWPMVEGEGDEKEPVRKELSAEEIAERFEGRYAQVLDARAEHASPSSTLPSTLVYNERHQPQAQKGATMVYLPLLPHACQPSYDPSTAPFSSSYNLVWTQDEVATIRRTSRACVREGMDEVRKAVREAYERRKGERLHAAA